MRLGFLSRGFREVAGEAASSCGGKAKGDGVVDES